MRHAEVKQELPVRVAVRGEAVEWLEVAVDAQRPHAPVAAAQLQAPQNDRLYRWRESFRHKHIR